MANAQVPFRRSTLPPIMGPRRQSASLDEHLPVLGELLESEPADFGKRDLALLNLLCASYLTGSEQLDAQCCLFRLDRLATHVRSTTERNLHRFPEDPDYGHCEPMWRMAMLVTCVKLDFGIVYDPVVKADLDRDGRSPFVDSRNVFIHGLLDDDPDRRRGSCSSIPVLVAAVARRLGYPVGLAVNRNHVYARWDHGGGFAFNVEASNAAGMVIHSDEYYRDKMFGPMTPVERQSGFYARTLRPAEEFALFLKNRVWCLCDTAKYEQTLLWSARALQLSPDDPHFAQEARMIAELAVKHRFRQKYPRKPIPPPERNHEFVFDLGEFTSVPERSLFLTIAAHGAESDGDLQRARTLYEDALRQNVYGHNEHRDLQRFLKKHDLPRQEGVLHVV